MSMSKSGKECAHECKHDCHKAEEPCGNCCRSCPFCGCNVGKSPSTNFAAHLLLCHTAEITIPIYPLNCFHICRCDCHKTGALHVLACCNRCVICGQNIEFDMMNIHLTTCHSTSNRPE